MSYVSMPDKLSVLYGNGIDFSKSFKPFLEAREFVRSLKIKNSSEWVEYCTSKKRPIYIPSSPNSTYKNKGWISYGDWFGNGNVAPFKRKYRSFIEAREFVRSLKLGGSKEWNEYCKSVKKPTDIPSSPNDIYKDKGWMGYGDWVGTGFVFGPKRQYRTFFEARKFVRLLKLKNREEWQQYCTSGKKPTDIPAVPKKVYKNCGWVDEKDWFGIIRIQYRPFQKARKFVRLLKFKSRKEWKQYCKSGKKPTDIPSVPDSFYKGNGWVSNGDWLGTGYIALFNRQYRPFQEAREFVKSLKLKNSSKWIGYCKSGKKPTDIPFCPHLGYKDKGWVNWGDWLGNGNIKYRSFQEAKAFAMSLKLKSISEWVEYCKSGDKPADIPASPQYLYKKQGWVRYADWLGK